MLIRVRQGARDLITKVYKSVGGLWFPEYDVLLPRGMNVIAVLETHDWRRPIKRLIPGMNIVTNDGDLHYAQRVVAETLTNAFGTHEMQSAAASGHPAKTSTRANFTAVASSQKATSTGYPTRDDADSDNTGAGTDIVTHRVAYTAGDFNAGSITHGIITNTSPATSEVILTGYAFAGAFAKGTNDTLKVFVNHEISGV
jgi:hypothetical protein